MIFVRSFSFAKGQQFFKIKPVNIQSRSLRTLIKTSANMELSIYTKPYLYSYKTETAIFIPTKHKKQLWQLFKFV